MLDHPLPATTGTSLRSLLPAKPTLPQIFQLGARLATSDPPPTTPTQRISVAGTVTIDYLTRAVACAVAAEGVYPLTYQAPFGSLVQEILASVPRYTCSHRR